MAVCLFAVSFCNELQNAAMGQDVCSLYTPGATCLGDILSGRFCDCPIGSTGLFCDRTYIEGSGRCLSRNLTVIVYIGVYIYIVNVINGELMDVQMVKQIEKLMGGSMNK